MRTGLLVLLIAIVMTGQAQEQEQEQEQDDRKCTAGDTTERCFAKLKTWPAAVNTGVSGLLTPTQSSTKDFLSQLAAAFAAPMTGDGPRPVSLAWNVPIPLLGGDQHALNLQAVFAKPEMSGALKERIGMNAAAVTTVNDSLSELDDLTVRASFGPSTKSLGRNATPHWDAYKSMVRTPAGAVANLDDVAKQFSRLLNNQPQIYGEVNYRAVKNVAGADERGVRLTYEMGFHNLNEFYAACGTKSLADCTSELTATAEAARDDRVAVSIEYRQWSALSVVIPDLVHFTAPRARSLVYSVTYGRDHMMIPKGRLDVEVNYEDTTARTVTDVIPPPVTITNGGGEAVRDRFVASATYTYQINGEMAMPLTITYANHGKYLGDVDRKLNAHFGLSFKMPSLP